MKKNMIERAVYGLLFGLGLGILFIKYKIVTMDSSGYTTDYMSSGEYIINVLKCGAAGSFLGCFSGWVYFKKTK